MPARLVRVLAASLAVLAASGASLAHDGVRHEGCPAGQEFAAGALTVTGAWSRATLPQANVAAGYMTISNAGAEADRLAGVATAAAETAEIHRMWIENEMMKMEVLPEGIEIPAAGSVTLDPGGLHLMFIGITQPFEAGDCVEVVLSFETAGELPVVLSVGDLSGSRAQGDHEGH